MQRSDGPAKLRPKTTMSSMRRIESRLETKLLGAPPRPNFQRRRSNNARTCVLAQDVHQSSDIFKMYKNGQRPVSNIDLAVPQTLSTIRLDSLPN